MKNGVRDNHSHRQHSQDVLDEPEDLRGAQSRAT